MKKFIAVSMAAVMALSLAGCSATKTGTYSYDVNGGKVVEEYSDQGLLTKKSSYDSDGFCSGFAVYEYDADGNMIRKTEYGYGIFTDENGEQMQIEAREEPPLMLEEEYYSNGMPSRMCMYGYTEQPQMVIEYDEKGSVTKQISYDSIDGSLKQCTVYEDSGSSTYDADNKLIQRTSSGYDEKGNYVREIFNGDGLCTDRNITEYDSNGNKTQETQYGYTAGAAQGELSAEPPIMYQIQYWADGMTVCRRTEYDEYGLVNKVTENDATGAKTQIISYKNTDGVCSGYSAVQFSSDGKMTVCYDYNADDVKISETHYDCTIFLDENGEELELFNSEVYSDYVIDYYLDGTVSRRAVYNQDGLPRSAIEYDENGVKRRVIGYDNADGAQNGYTVLEYDADGNCIGQYKYNADGELIG